MLKSLPHIVLLLAFMYISSCTKENNVLLQNTTVEIFPSDSDMAALGMVQLDDGNFILAGYDNHSPNNYPRKPGRIIKMTADGRIIWDKRLSEVSRTLFRILPVPGDGFITFGIQEHWSYTMDICLYNDDGDSVLAKKVSSNVHNSWNEPYDIIRLSNGNYAVAGSETGSVLKGHLRILSPDFNTLYTRQFNWVSIQALCETANGSIALTTSNSLIRTDLTGFQKSVTNFYDSLYYETSNTIIPYGNSIFAFTARMPANNTGYGTLVNYAYNFNDFGLPVSGSINMLKFSGDSIFQERRIINDYPQNGMMNSVRATSDGGFVCCGTVDQATLPIAVSKTKIYLLKLDANLNTQWSKIVNTSYQSFGVDAIQTPDGGFLVSGYQRSMNQRYEMMVIKTDANGNF